MNQVKENYIEVLADIAWPEKDFHEDCHSRPQYNENESWAALPGMESGALKVPQGVTRPKSDDLIADVFYLHPTTYPLSGYHGFGPGDINEIGASADWNQSVYDAQTRLWTDDLLIKQASVFNSCCRIYAPRYRQANIMVLADMAMGKGDNAKQALALAYEDIKNAFMYYLENHNEGRPFIIAGHSQGSYHGQFLLKECISGSKLHELLIAACLIGINISSEYMNLIPDIPACQHFDQLGCLFGYRSWLGPHTNDYHKQELCINPLSWDTTTEYIHRDRHLGAVYFSKDTRHLSVPVLQTCSTHCVDGLLLVDCDRPDILVQWPGEEKNLHVCDYELFYMDLRENIQRRVDTYYLKAGE